MSPSPRPAAPAPAASGDGTRDRPPRGLAHDRTFLVMALLAAAGLVGFLVIHRIADGLRDEIVEVGRPAREVAEEAQIAFTVHAYSLEKFLRTEDPHFLDGHREAVATGEALRRRLGPLLERLGLAGSPPARELETLLPTWFGQVSGLLEGRMSRAAFDALAVERDRLHSEVLRAHAELRQAINQHISARVQAIDRLQRLQALLAGTLALLALAAALARTRLAVRERRSRRVAEQRAREEAALREAAAAVGSALTAEAAARRVARAALAAIDADGALVERAAPGGGALAVVGVAGAAPAAPDREARRLTVALPGARGPSGRFTLTRSADHPPFAPSDEERLRAFGELAALAFTRLRLLEETEQRSRELERVTESRAKLIRGFSHDVRNALGAADGYASLLEEGIGGDLNPRQRRSVGQLRSSVRSALELTEDLLQLARAEAGQIPVHRQEVDLGALARESLERHRRAAGAKALDLSLALPERIPELTSDPRRIEQVLGNLVSNAVKYTPAGGTVRLQLEACSGAGAPGDGRWVAVRVEDNGPGIAPEHQPRIFEEFTRLQPEQGRGMGMGLAISRHVARALGGELTLETAPGEGSTFTLWLPLAPERKRDAPRAPRGGAPGARRAGGRVPGAPSGDPPRMAS